MTSVTSSDHYLYVHPNSLTVLALLLRRQGTFLSYCGRRKAQAMAPVVAATPVGRGRGGTGLRLWRLCSLGRTSLEAHRLQPDWSWMSAAAAAAVAIAAVTTSVFGGALAVSSAPACGAAASSGSVDGACTLGSLGPSFRLPVPAVRLAEAAAAGRPPPGAPLVLPLGAGAPRPARPGSSRGFPAVVRIHERVVGAMKTAGAAGSAVADDGDMLPETTARWTSRLEAVNLKGGIVAVGEYYAEVQLGGQMVRVQIDTGSTTLAVPMEECESCRKGDMRYSVSKSVGKVGRPVPCDGDVCTPNMCSPFSCGKCSATKACCSKLNTDNCGFHLSFGDGSGASGELVIDNLTWGNNITFPVVFGGILKDSPDFERSTVDGILGLAWPKLACNPSCVEPTFDAMVRHLKIDNIFSMCITGTGGKLVLGGHDTTLAKADPVWVPMVLRSPPSYYPFKVTGPLRIGDRDATELPPLRKGIVDSGTTLIVFSQHYWNLFVEHMQKHYCDDIPSLCEKTTWFRPAHCVRISDEELDKMPTLRFPLENDFVIELTSREYMVDYPSKSSRCVGFMALDSMSGGIDWIAGNVVMEKYVTIYDRAAKRIGFALSKGGCVSTAIADAAPDAAVGPATPTAAPEGTKPDAEQAATGTAAAPRAPNVSAAKCEAATADGCTACASLRGCAWHYTQKTCGLRPGATGGDAGGLAASVPYPSCAGASCWCSAAGFASSFWRVVGTAVGAVLASLVLVGAVVGGVVRRRRRLAAAAAPAEDGDVLREQARPFADSESF